MILDDGELAMGHHAVNEDRERPRCPVSNPLGQAVCIGV
jgi:hypothetical protein